MLVREKHSSLLDQFLSYEKNEVLWIRTQEPTLDGEYQTEKLGCDKPSSLFCPTVSDKEKLMYNNDTISWCHKTF